MAFLTLVLAGTTACGSTSTSAGRRFEPRIAGTLTVATAYLPAPSLWIPNHQTYAGFEAGLAEAIADELGVEEVEVVQVPFADLVAGDLGGADIAISTITPTAERDRVLDFTSPYLDAPPGVLVRPGTEVRDAQDLRALRWAVVGASTLTDVVTERIRPDEAPLEVDDRTEQLRALRGDEADAVLLDLPVAQGLAASAPTLYEVAGQLSRGETLAVALPDGSPNLEIVDSAVRALRADGTIDRLADRWLGSSGDEIPLIRVAS
ncbi:MAG: ABC transporter substrate-binding protein [Acidimicrobiales bacterium]